MTKTELSQQKWWRQAAAKWDRLTIADDRMFSMVMENDQICLALLHRIFPALPIKRVQRLTVQKQVNAPLDARAVRFDVDIRDDKGRTYIVEMQVANRHNLPYRLRYYLEQSDHGVLGPGDDYNKLKKYPTYVIFFCDFDYYQQGWSEYRFEWRCLRDPKLAAQTGQQLVVFNAKAADFHDNIGLEGFLKLMHNQVKAGDPLVEQVQREMTRIKQDPERRRLFMKYELDLMDARRDGREEGLEKGRNRQRTEDIRLAVKLLRQNQITDQVIAHNLMDSYDLSQQEAWRYLKKD